MKPKRIEILGVPVDCVTMESALDAVDTMVAGARPQVIIAVNPEKVLLARKDPTLLARLRSAGLLIPDGIGIVLAARWHGLGKMRRVAGADLMPAICERSVARGYKVFLLGARPEVNQRAVEVLRQRYPGLQIVGHQHGYLDDTAMPELVERINASGAQILFIAMGSPRQELWMDSFLDKLDVRVCQGVGGTFDVISGYVKRAPALVHALHLEWLYRDLRPSRLKRIVPKLRFAVHALMHRAG